MIRMFSNHKNIVSIFLSIFMVLGIQITSYGDVTPVTDRTSQVRDAIVTAAGENTADEVTETHLAAITSLNLRNAGISELQSGDFSGLTGLTSLNLYGNQLSSLPDGIFEGLTALTTLRLGGNTVDPLPIAVSLEKVEDGQFKVVAPTGAPYDIVVPVSATNGSIADSATTLTISKGSTSSDTLTVTRTVDTTTAVTANIGTLPSLPQNHFGYVLTKSDTLPLEVITAIVTDTTEETTDTTEETTDTTDTTEQTTENVAPMFTDGTTTIRSIAENTAANTNIGSAVSATDADEDDTLTYTLGGTDAADFDIDSSSGQLKTKTSLDYETKQIYIITITASDGTLTDTINVIISIIDVADTSVATTTLLVSDRTPEVRDAIVTAVPGVSNANDVTDAHLAAISSLDLRSASISELKTGDFGGLTALTSINLYGNMLSNLPIGIFEGLTSLTSLRLGGNLVDPFPLIVSLQQVNVNQFRAIIPTGAPFDVVLPINSASITAATILKGSIESTTFTATTDVNIGSLPSLPTNHYGYILAKSGVCNRTQEVTDAIAEAVPGIDNCQNVTEVQIATITSLDLSNKSITSLQADDFSGLLSLSTLNLSNNQLDSLPDGIFEGLTSLTTLNLSGNSVDPLPLVVSLQKVGINQVKAVVPSGAPIDITLPITVANGSLVGNATTITIPSGSVESQLLTVIRTSNTFAAVTVDISSLPTPPANHTGYVLTKSSELPVEIFSSTNSAPVFTEGTETTRTVDENTQADINIGSAITATDANNDTLTYTLSGTDATVFDIDDTTGQLKTKAALDYETKSSYSVTITVSDGSLSDTITVTISITDVTENRAPVFTEGSSATRTVAENTGSGVNIGTAVSATDADADTLTYTLTGTDAASYDIDSETGQLKTKAALDYETQTSYAVTVSVSDGDLTDNIDVTINVTDLNEVGGGDTVDTQTENTAPVFTAGTAITLTVEENTASSVNIGIAVSATDEDGDTLAYSLGGTDAAAFDIGTTNGQIKTKVALDYETKNSYSVTITVSDDNDATATINVTINITDVNDAPQFATTTATRSTPENTAADQIVGSPISASDEDGDTLIYSLGGTDAAAFDIDTTNGQIKTKVALDYETKNSYILTVTATDSGNLTGTVSVTIHVTNIHEQDTNNSPVFTDGTNTIRSIPENTSAGQNIGSPISATDGDSDILTYSLGGTDAAAFDIDTTNGQIKTKASLDFENNTSYSVTINVTDDIDSDVSIQVTIIVTDVLESMPLSERTAKVRNAIVDAVDGVTNPNDINDTHLAAIKTLRISSIQDSTLKTRDFEGLSSLIKLEVVFNRSLSSLPSGIFGGLSALTELHIYGNSLSSLPADIFDGLSSLEKLSLHANSISGLPAQIFNGLSSLKILELSQNSLSSLPSGIFGGLSALTELFLYNNSLSSLPTDIFDGLSSLTDIDLSENQITSLPAGVFSGMSSLDDLNMSDNPGVPFPGTVSLEKVTEGEFKAIVDTGAPFEITLPVSVDNGTIDGDTTLITIPIGNVASNNTLTVTRTSETTAPVVVQIDTLPVVPDSIDGYSLVKSGELPLNVIPATAVLPNTAPVFRDGNDTNRSVAENTPAGRNIGSPVSATDAEGDNLTYTLHGTDVQSFDIGSTSGQLTTKAALNYETKNAYSVRVIVKDEDLLLDSINVTINVTDVNEPPQFVTESVIYTVPENTPAGENIGTPETATDEDGDTITYGLAGTDADSFDINSASGQLLTKAALDYETKNSYSLEIHATDDDSLSDSIQVTINITDVILEDTDVTTHNTTTDNTDDPDPPFYELETDSRSVEENTPAGENIGSPVTPTNTDNNTLTYSLSSDGTDADNFTIDSTTGQLLTKGYLDHESKSSYLVTVNIIDEYSNSDSIDVTINVTNVCEVGDVINRNGQCTYPGTNAIFSAVTPGPVLDTEGIDFWYTGQDKINLNDRRVGDLSYTFVAQKRNNGSWIIQKLGASSGNDGPVFKDGNTTTRNVQEEVPIGHAIGTAVSATDADENTLTYSLSGTDADTFSIDNTTGQLKTNATLDYETKDSYSVNVSVSDGDGGSNTIDVTININNVCEVGELLSVGNSCLYPGTDSYFTVSGTGAEFANGNASVISHIEIELQNTKLSNDPVYYTFHAEKLNNGKWSIEDVGNFNYLPVFTEGSSTTRRVTENTPTNRKIGRPISATDADGDTLTYRLGGSDASEFRFNTSTGQLRTKNDIDYETKTSYSVTITVVDGNGGSANINVTINVNDVRDKTDNDYTISSFSCTSSFVNHRRIRGTLTANTPIKVLRIDGKINDEIIGSDNFNVDLSIDETIDFNILGVWFTQGTETCTVDVIYLLNPLDEGNAPLAAHTPAKNSLLPNYPNPFNPETWIPYQLTKPSDVTITVYNMRGVVVRKLALGYKPAGYYTNRSRAAHWDGRNNIGERAATGVYFCTIKAGDYTATRKMLIRK